MKERRQRKRYIKSCVTEFIVQNITYRGLSSNFSLDGLFIWTNSPFSPDTILDIVIYLPDGATSKIRGKVRTALRTSDKEAMATQEKSILNGMGVEIIEKDVHYLHFVSSLVIGKN
jgi:hypothetical protein